MASISSSSLMDFTTNARAPASKALSINSSALCMVKINTSICGRAFLDLARRLNSIQLGHAYVQDSDIRFQLQSELDGLAPIGRFSAHLPISILLQSSSQPLTHYFVIVR